jgi:hypothetical protein
MADIEAHRDDEQIGAQDGDTNEEVRYSSCGMVAL